MSLPDSSVLLPSGAVVLLSTTGWAIVDVISTGYDWPLSAKVTLAIILSMLNIILSFMWFGYHAFKMRTDVINMLPFIINMAIVAMYIYYKLT